ncbi:MAG: hypothetical protein GY856_00670, partial [bacterium]|nr:hypothetical protein [bacterium]
MRPDLLALGPDDLAALANRGTVKRATRELGRYDYEITEDDDGVTVRWSDDVSCVLPAGKSLAEATCSCRATGLCRHLIRSVLACQAVVDDEDDVDVAADVGVDFWDPGAISDAALAALFPRATLTRLRSSFEREALVELVRSARPTARFLLRSATVRFLVAGDPRYTVCNCAEEAPCRHVPLAVWAFRRLPEAESGALVEVGAGLPAPADLLDEIERLLLDLTELGISGTARAWR